MVHASCCWASGPCGCWLLVLIATSGATSSLATDEAAASGDDGSTRASRPTALAAIAPTEVSFQVKWSAGINVGPCQFKAWHVSLRLRRPLGEWMLRDECLNLSRGQTSCSIQELQKNTEYDVRVLESCLEPSHNSLAAVLKVPFWTLPGEWSQHVGASKTPSKVVDVGSAARYCRVVKQCCKDEFGVCFTAGTSEVTVMRSDVPGGWGQDLSLRCHAQAMSAWAGSDLDLMPAAAPSLLQVEETTSTTLSFKYKFGAMGDCACASVEMQLRSGEDGPWQAFPQGACPDMLARRCELRDLRPNTLYQVRARITCPSNSMLNSNYTEAQPRATKPGCTYSGTSGVEDQVECADGTLCDFNIADGGCCNKRGGRARCPRNSPVMCTARKCAGGKDHCCEADAGACKEFGGVRACNVASLPPQLVGVQAKTHDSIILQWKAQEFLEGRSGCDFVQWHGEVALINQRGELEEWRLGCAVKEYQVTWCSMTGLTPLNPYSVRMTQVCRDSSFNSEPAVYPHEVWTRGVKAQPPLNLEVLNVSPSGFDVIWQPGLGNDCKFASWEVEGFRVDAAHRKEDPWLSFCVLAQRNITHCHVDGLPSKAQYQVRIRETCLDSNSTSDYTVERKVIKIKRPPVRAAPAWNASVRGLTPSSVRVSWNAGRDRGDCEFVAWQVFVWPTATLDGPALPFMGSPHSFSTADEQGKPAGVCRLEARQSSSCVVQNLPSLTRHTAYVREECLVEATYSPWVAASPGWTLPMRAGSPKLKNTTVLSHHELRIHWEPGDPNDCVFKSWRIFVLDGSGSWMPYAAKCQPTTAASEELRRRSRLKWLKRSLARREATVCVLRELDSNTDYAVRLQEVCRDERANSAYATWSAHTSNSEALESESEDDEDLGGADVDEAMVDIMRDQRVSTSRDMMSAMMGAAAAFIAMSCSQSRAWAIPRRWLRRRCAPRDI